MIQSRRMLAAVALACVIVGGCQKKAAEGTKATGEVLEGTVSDAMIATDQTRSEPPLAPHSARADDAKGSKAKAGHDDPEGADAAAAPTVTPTPEAISAPKPAASEPAA